jgi:hypothetical protein
MDVMRGVKKGMKKSLFLTYIEVMLLEKCSKDKAYNVIRIVKKKYHYTRKELKITAKDYGRHVGYTLDEIYDILGWA